MPDDFRIPGRYSERLPCTPESARTARRIALAALTSWGLDSVSDRAESVVSELVGNAVSHTHSACVRVTVSRADDDTVRICVADESHLLPIPRAAGADEAGGRGLGIVAALSKDWGFDVLRWGKGVWATLAPEPVMAGVS